MKALLRLLSLIPVAAFSAVAMVTLVPPVFAEQGGFVPVEALRRGGYVILLRHATTQRAPEPAPLDLANCAVQVPLTGQGREEARAIGAAFRVLDIPMGRVLASPCCRTLETARLAFGRVDAISDILLRNTYVPMPGASVPPGWPQRIELLRKLLATPPATGTNTGRVTHGENIREAVGFEAAFAETVVYRPHGRGSFVLVARVLPAQWTTTAAAYRR